MTLREFLKVLSNSISYTIGAKDGYGWLVYYDGEHVIEVPDDLADRPVTLIYQRERREKERTCCELKAGLAIVVEGCENGSI